LVYYQFTGCCDDIPFRIEQVDFFEVPVIGSTYLIAIQTGSICATRVDYSGEGQIIDAGIAGAGITLYNNCNDCITSNPCPSTTPTPTPTSTLTETPTPTVTQTNTPTPTSTLTETPIPTVTQTNTPTPTYTLTETPTPTPTVTQTNTPTSPSVTPTNTPTQTPQSLTCNPVFAINVSGSEVLGESFINATITLTNNVTQNTQIDLFVVTDLAPAGTVVNVTILSGNNVGNGETSLGILNVPPVIQSYCIDNVDNNTISCTGYNCVGYECPCTEIPVTPTPTPTQTYIPV
jgi:hypothetical protein